MSEEQNQRILETSFVEYPNRRKQLEEKQAAKRPRLEDKILSRQEAAEYLGISLSSIDRLIRDQRIPFYKVLNRTLFSQKRLAEWKILKETIPVENFLLKSRIYLLKPVVLVLKCSAQIRFIFMDGFAYYHDMVYSKKRSENFYSPYVNRSLVCTQIS